VGKTHASWLIAAACGCAIAGAAAQVADVRQGTNITLALAPDGTNLVVDLLGGLWQLPATGGGAITLVPADSGVGQPRFHPDGRRIVVQRWLDGQWDLWMYTLDGNDWHALTHTPHDEREPEFSADGNSVLFAANPAGHFTLWTLDLGDGAVRQLTDEPGNSGFPAVSDSGDLAYVHRDERGSSLRLYSDSGVGAEVFRSEHWLASPSWRPGGRVLVFNEVDGARSSTLRMLVLADEPVLKDLTHAEDVFTGRVAWRSAAQLIYTADGQIWQRGIGETMRTPLHLIAGVGLAASAATVVAAPLDAPGPHRAGGSVGVSAARDGDVTAFAALGDLWLAERRGVRQLTDDAFVDAFPSLNPAGDELIFVSDRGGNMDLWHMNLRNNVVAQLTGDAAKPFEPTLDPTGRRVAYLEPEGLGPWSEAALQVLDVAQPYRPTTLARGLYAARGLRWSQTGGALELRLEASRDRAHAPREQLRFAAGTSATAATTGATAALREDLAPEWTPLAPAEAYVIEAGRICGIRDDYQRHMDIHVAGQRITAVVRRGALPAPSKVIDARDATVYPGLIDVHVHQSVASGERLGRMWLVNGVTTVREITDNVPEALERAEAWASGRRMGPRLVISPGPAAGGRVATTSSVVMAAYPQVSPGFAHLLYGQRERLGIPELELRAPLTEIVEGNEGSRLPYFRVSTRNVSYQDTVATLLASQTAVSTGVSALAGWPQASHGRDRSWSASLAALFSPSELGTWARGGTADPTVIAPLQDTVARLVRSSGHVAIASDAPAVPYGYGVHAELTLLAEAGIPNDQILRLASSGGAMALGLGQQLGTIEPGKLADLVVVDGDPLARISDAATVHAVVRGGVWITRAELLARPSP
jgi:dipeptidyl aminopeptidase/acylaminoacyl peptidase